MTPLWTTSSTSWINDRAAGIEFDAVCSAYMKLVDKLSTEKAPKDFLQQVYVMFVFDPDCEGIEKRKYFKRRNEVEARVVVEREEFKCLDQAGRRSLLHTRLVDTLEAIRRDLEGKVKHELDALISAVRALEPGVATADAAAVSVSATENKPSDTKPRMAGLQESPEDEAKKEFQLVLQFPESSFEDEDDMFGLEECLAEVLADKADVDGNDVGCGKFNIFILTDKPAEVFDFLCPFLKRAKLLEAMRVAFTELGEDDYRVLWPKGDNVPFEL